MNGTTTVTLPGGFWLDGVCHREAGLHPLNGSDEAFIQEVADSLLPAHRTTAILGRCLTHLGPLNQVTPEMVRSLTVGDREALLLHLRQLTIGERMQCVLSCPHTDCGERMDLELKVSDLLLPAYLQPEERYETTVGENGNNYIVRFRLPTGADQEAAAGLAYRNPDAAADLILRRCVNSVTLEGKNSKSLEDWSPAVGLQLPAIMAKLDPHAELTLNLSCPVCNHDFLSIFDTATYLYQELAVRSRYICRDVHLLAFYYHWSEKEIMGLSSWRRRRYVLFLEDTLMKELQR